MRNRPSVVLFDVVETLFSLQPVEDVLAPVGVGLDLFFARLLRDGFALAAAGSYKPFSEIVTAVLAALAPDASRDERSQVQRAFEQLPPYPDAEGALAKLSDAGIRICTLTNGGADVTTKLLDNSGLGRYIEGVLSVEAVQQWKPSPAPYNAAVATLGCESGDVALVAVHSWDIHGAHRAGLRTGWCSRLEGTYPAVFDPPDVTGENLIAVADKLLEAPSH